MKKVIALALIGAALSACATPPTAQQVASADYGPFPDSYQETIKTYMASVLKDPDSARFDFSRTPVKAWYGYGEKTFGWATCAGVNAKNSYGGYTGSQPSYFFMRNGYVQQARHGGTDGSLENGIVREMCSRL